MTRSPWSCILWDVDGTIIDASIGILRRLATVLTEFGRTPPKREELAYWIGPSMFDSFQDRAGMTPEEATRAVTAYRKLGRADGYTSDLRTYPGVVDLIHAVHTAGIAQATASSKPEIQVSAIVDHLELRRSFAAVVGASLDERTLGKKADIVAEALRRLEVAGIDVSRPVLIGDRHHDIEGGEANDVPVIFVRWGFSWPHEAEGAQATVDDVEQLRALLLIEDRD